MIENEKRDEKIKGITAMLSPFITLINTTVVDLYKDESANPFIFQSEGNGVVTFVLGGMNKEKLDKAIKFLSKLANENIGMTTYVIKE